MSTNPPPNSKAPSTAFKRRPRRNTRCNVVGRVTRAGAVNLLKGDAYRRYSAGDVRRCRIALSLTGQRSRLA